MRRTTSRAFFGVSPDQATFEDLRRYQLHLRNQGVGAATINSTVWALRFLFKVTLRCAEIADQLCCVRGPRKLPVVLSFEEVGCLLEAAPGLKYKAAFSIAYGARLRASEVVSLKVSDIRDAVRRFLSAVKSIAAEPGWP